MGASITGVGTALPERSVDNAELAERLGITEEWIATRTGIESRHVAGPADSTASLAARAARSALAVAGTEAGEIDLVIVATVTPDLAIPSTASLVQHQLGAERAGAFDLNAGCSGFLYALCQAASAVDSFFHKALVIGSDVLTRVADFGDPKSCVLFGDGAGAVVVERNEVGQDLGPFLLGSDGADPDLLCIPRSTGVISMKGREVYRRAVDEMATSISAVARRAGMGLDEIDLVAAHQANARILEAVADRLGLPAAKVPSNIEHLGNTSAASIPLVLDELVRTGTLRQGSRIVLAAFGAGFTWGAGLACWTAAPSRVPVEEVPQHV